MLNQTTIQNHLAFLYSKEKAEQIWPKLDILLKDFQQGNSHLLNNVSAASERVTEQDAILITYGDQISEQGKPPLQSLTEVLIQYIKGTLSGVHILPFFPYSSDDGFSIIDHTKVNPDFGDWDNIEQLGQHFRLMFDLVINHVSRHSQWFQSFQNGDARYADYFITVEPGADTSHVTRPRAKPLLTPIKTSAGEIMVWTTFSPDQIDLNFSSPDLLLEIIKILLLYVEKGAEIIRLDAIAYIWKELGTTCIHLEEVHEIVRLFRTILNTVAPNTILLTETNVPHAENVSYFGDGFNEAQMVYQFPLPPLVLHTFVEEDASNLSRWAADLKAPSDETTFFNFLASHDGIGIRPVEGILTPSETQALIARASAHGGNISYKTNSDGSKSAYELNISYFDAISDPNGDESLELQTKRFLASQAIILSLAGVPGIYVHSLFGSRNYYEGVEKSGRFRSINRKKFQRGEFENALANPDTTTAQVFDGYTHLLKIRRQHPAFHPQGPQQIIPLDKRVFAILRTSPDNNEQILCLINVSNQHLHLRLDSCPDALPPTSRWCDLLSVPNCFQASDSPPLKIAPYQILWLQKQ